MNAEERTRIHMLLRDLEYFIGGTLGDGDTVPVNLELKPGSKPFNIEYYPFPRINKENFHK